MESQATPQLITDATLQLKQILPDAPDHYALSTIAGAANEELLRQVDTKLKELLHNAAPDELRQVLTHCTRVLTPRADDAAEQAAQSINGSESAS
jgi:hypothetical protein